MANRIYGAIGVAGGGAGDLDSIDGSVLSTNDKGIVTTATKGYIYHMNAASGATENLPWTVGPDNNRGVKRWHLVDYYSAATLHHAPRHIRGGADEVDGDKVDIDWNPSYYTPATPPVQVNNIDELTAHLYGIDRQFNADIDLAGRFIEFDAAPAIDESGNGIIVMITVGASVATAELLYLKNDQKFYKTDADAEATTKGMLALATQATGINGVIPGLLKGFYRNDAWTWGTADQLHISTTAGAIVATPSTATGDIVRIIGYAYSPDIIYFDPDNTYIEIS